MSLRACNLTARFLAPPNCESRPRIGLSRACEVLFPYSVRDALRLTSSGKPICSSHRHCPKQYRTPLSRCERATARRAQCTKFVKVRFSYCEICCPHFLQAPPRTVTDNADQRWPAERSKMPSTGLGQIVAGVCRVLCCVPLRGDERKPVFK